MNIKFNYFQMNISIYVFKEHAFLYFKNNYFY